VSENDELLGVGLQAIPELTVVNRREKMSLKMLQVFRVAHIEFTSSLSKKASLDALSHI
jgi:hypothetical protein